MGIGIAVGALAIIGLAVFFWRRHKKDKAERDAAAGAAGTVEAGRSDKPNLSQQYQQSPHGGYYAPVSNKDHPNSPGAPVAGAYGAQGYQNYQQQPYGGQYGYQQQQTYQQQPPQELGAVGNTPSELPGNHYNPSLLGDHVPNSTATASPGHTYGSPQSGYANTVGTGTYDSTQSAPHGGYPTPGAAPHH
ncbi:hypothetical protein Micbo1qcDRAFT_161690 [Microdochium bolleyi]|uniref:Uncharacterized protein n=1 Tax=Microdochium bolleyi TaxID=196109 RepID=A0A136J3L4_9PEZI|nr:hypothetical protein Micbo1qcDRAFT_161690 [Microdochium bolleyi]